MNIMYRNKHEKIMIKKEKTKTLLNTFKDIISSKTFAYILNFILFIIFCTFIWLKLDFGIIAKAILVWTNIMVYIIINILIWRYKDEYNYDEELVEGIGMVLFISAVLIYGLGGMGGLVEVSKTIKTETYAPINIIKTNTKIIIIGKTHTLESTSIADLMNENIKICKDENINTWNMRISDTWYICDN